MIQKILNEYQMLMGKRREYFVELSSLPKGYISFKTINGKEYAYLQLRSGSKVEGRYIPKSDIQVTKDALQRRKDIEAEYPHIIKRIKEIRLVLPNRSVVLYPQI